jgi:hypothetical protein
MKTIVSASLSVLILSAYSAFNLHHQHGLNYQCARKSDHHCLWKWLRNCTYCHYTRVSRVHRFRLRQTTSTSPISRQRTASARARETPE